VVYPIVVTSGLYLHVQQVPRAYLPPTWTEPTYSQHKVILCEAMDSICRWVTANNASAEQAVSPPAKVSCNCRRTARETQTVENMMMTMVFMSNSKPKALRQ
jgi:hypothetical protein